MTPEFDEIARVSVCPYNMITGYTLFVEDEERAANAILTRGDMEAHMVRGGGGGACCPPCWRRPWLRAAQVAAAA
jgi:hypothetical protein